MNILECVPNFSEGVNPENVAAIAAVLKISPGIHFIDYSGDSDHNRSVFTFIN